MCISYILSGEKDNYSSSEEVIKGKEEFIIAESIHRIVITACYGINNNFFQENLKLAEIKDLKPIHVYRRNIWFMSERNICLYNRVLVDV